MSLRNGWQRIRTYFYSWPPRIAQAELLIVFLILMVLIPSLTTLENWWNKQSDLVIRFLIFFLFFGLIFAPPLFIILKFKQTYDTNEERQYTFIWFHALKEYERISLVSSGLSLFYLVVYGTIKSYLNEMWSYIQVVVILYLIILSINYLTDNEFVAASHIIFVFLPISIGILGSTIEFLSKMAVLSLFIFFEHWVLISMWSSRPEFLPFKAALRITFRKKFLNTKYALMKIIPLMQRYSKDVLGLKLRKEKVEEIVKTFALRELKIKGYTRSWLYRIRDDFVKNALEIRDEAKKINDISFLKFKIKSSLVESFYKELEKELIKVNIEACEVQGDVEGQILAFPIFLRKENIERYWKTVKPLIFLVQIGSLLLYILGILGILNVPENIIAIVEKILSIPLPK